MQMYNFSGLELVEMVLNYQTLSMVKTKTKINDSSLTYNIEKLNSFSNE